MTFARYAAVQHAIRAPIEQRQLTLPARRPHTPARAFAPPCSTSQVSTTLAPPADLRSGKNAFSFSSARVCNLFTSDIHPSTSCTKLGPWRFRHCATITQINPTVRYYYPGESAQAYSEGRYTYRTGPGRVQEFIAGRNGTRIATQKSNQYTTATASYHGLPPSFSDVYSDNLPHIGTILVRSLEMVQPRTFVPMYTKLWFPTFRWCDGAWVRLVALTLKRFTWDMHVMILHFNSSLCRCSALWKRSTPVPLIIRVVEKSKPGNRSAMYTGLAYADTEIATFATNDTLCGLAVLTNL